MNEKINQPANDHEMMEVIVKASSEESGEPVQMRRLARAFVARILLKGM